MALEAIDPESELRSGLLLAGKYRLESEIGRGAMGTVWSAVHVSLGQRVAIKVISPEHADSDDLRRRFDTEARAAAKLRSRFVVGVFDHGTTARGLPYIVMEFLEGECLEDRIARFGTISLPEAARIARHVGRALTRAHAHGIVHRDLKPANIFITKGEEDDDGDWIAKVLDFGIAKTDDYSDRSTTKTGTVLGTPLFMSPEQVRGASSVDSRADLYSLGMVIYNMLTGTYAFEGQSFGDLLVSICTDPLPSLIDHAPAGLPARLDPWFKLACARDVTARYQTADDLVRGFDDAIGEIVGRVSLVESAVQTLRTTDHLAATFVAESGTGTTPHGVLPFGSEGRPGLQSASPSTVTLPGHARPSHSKRNLIIGAALISAAGLGAVIAVRSNSQPGSTEPHTTSSEIVLDKPDAPTAEPTSAAPDVTPTPTAAASAELTAEPSTPEPSATAKPTGQKPTHGGAKPPVAVTPAVPPPVEPHPPVSKPEPKPTTTDVGF